MTSILILAGRRDGQAGALAAAHGLSHKCVVPVAGKPMIAWVLEAAEATGWPVTVSLGEPGLIGSLAVVRRLEAAGRLAWAEPRDNLADSVVAGATGFPLVVTTADNVLVTPAAIEAVAGVAEERDAAVVMALAREEAIRAAHPDGQRRFYRFHDGGYSNCNLFVLRDAGALRAAETFRGGGQFAKHPRRIVAAFGIAALVRFRLGLLSLDGLMRTLSRRLGTKVVAHVFAEGRLAIDVDNERTLRVAEALLAEHLGGG